jgi:hypothetical protein
VYRWSEKVEIYNKKQIFISCQATRMEVGDPMKQ